jgi:predicted nucleic acid-binding protein
VRSYADTGFLVSLYLPETTTAAASTAFRKLEPPLPLTPLGFLELQVAFYLAVFRGLLSEPQRREIWQLVEADIDGGIFALTPVPSALLHDRAAKLAAKYSPTTGMRTLDLLHVAAAMLLGAERMFTFDQRQRKAATGEGLRALPR